MAENGEMAKAYYISISISIQHTKHDEQGKNNDVKAKPRRTDTFGPTHTHKSGWNGWAKSIGIYIYIYVQPYPGVLPGLWNFRSGLCYKAENVT